jgi:PAS domain S-box-containing protein
MGGITVYVGDDPDHSTLHLEGGEATMPKPKPLRVLYAEDDPASARLLQKRLKSFGYAVDTAPDGEEALAMWNQGSYDLLIVDHDMPRKTGLEVIRTLVSGGSRPPIIMITGVGNEDIAVEAMKLGIGDYLVKDVQGRYLELIGGKILEALDKHYSIEEKRRREEALQTEVEKKATQVTKIAKSLQIESRERMRAEKGLIETEQRFRAIFESALDCIFIKDRALRYTLINPYMENLLGIEASEIVGRTDEDLFGPQIAGIVAEQEYRVLKGDTRQLEQTRKIRGRDLTFLDIRVPLRDDRGEIVGICGICRNISESSVVGRRLGPRLVSQYPSRAVKATMDQALKVASTNAMVLLTGESGSGKDYLARAIHDNSHRADGAYRSVNCAAIPAELAEAELFGYEAGAFTGAARQPKRGLLELAEGGTLLLNEIGELSLPLQAKLLTFLDTREFIPVGGLKERKVDARLILATNRDLEKEVAEGRFRLDLYHRINVFSITVPPLRERREDIPLLVGEIISEIVGDLQLPAPSGVGPGIMKALQNYPWPGNVRELRNVLERGLILCQGGPLTLESLGISEDRTEDWTMTFGFPEDRSFDDLIKDIKCSLIEEALRRSGGKKEKAAHLLGISRFVMARQIKSLACGEQGRPPAEAR